VHKIKRFFVIWFYFFKSLPYVLGNGTQETEEKKDEDEILAEDEGELWDEHLEPPTKYRDPFGKKGFFRNLDNL